MPIKVQSLDKYNVLFDIEKTSKVTKRSYVFSEDLNISSMHPTYGS